MKLRYFVRPSRSQPGNLDVAMAESNSYSSPRFGAYGSGRILTVRTKAKPTAVHWALWATQRMDLSHGFVDSSELGVFPLFSWVIPCTIVKRPRNAEYPRGGDLTTWHQSFGQCAEKSGHWRDQYTVNLSGHDNNSRNAALTS